MSSLSEARKAPLSVIEEGAIGKQWERILQSNTDYCEDVECDRRCHNPSAVLNFWQTVKSTQKVKLIELYRNHKYDFLKSISLTNIGKTYFELEDTITF